VDLAVDPQIRHARGEDRERLLHLRPGEVGAETVVRAAAEGERRHPLDRDVEALGLRVRGRVVVRRRSGERQSVPAGMT
jgi:hypothetical protein